MSEMKVTKEMRERQVARHFKSQTLIDWADRIDADIAELVGAASGVESLARLNAAPLRAYAAAVNRLSAALIPFTGDAQ